MVIVSYLLDKAREKGYKQGYADGYAQGLAEGRAEAYKDADKQINAYFKRMDAARKAGEDFNEPRPRFGSKGRQPRLWRRYPRLA